MLIQEFVQRLLAHMGVENAEVIIEDGEERMIVQINVPEEDSGLLIGYHGEVLASLQKILQIIYMPKRQDAAEDAAQKRIVVNINDYKERREAQLKELANKIAFRVLETGESYPFSFMPSSERLIIHQTIAENPEFIELESISVGEGNNRRLHIRFKQDAAA